MKLTNEEKRVIAEWMGWGLYPIIYNFDLNSAGLCGAEMQKRGEWKDFEDSVDIYLWAETTISTTAWLFTTESGEATNFFRSMFEWAKERKGK